MEIEKSDQNRKLKKFLILSLLGLLLINIPLISGIILVKLYGTFTLYPGEHYTVNIPFIGPSRFSTVCGTAEQTDGTLLQGINVTLKNSTSGYFYATNITDNNGKFCFTLNITSNKKFDVYVQYDNSTLTLASNDYDLDFDNYKVYNRSSDNYAVLTGDIINEDAKVENGRFEINLKYNETGKFTSSKEIFDYQKYLLNIDPNEVYSVPSSELTVSWPINSSTEIGVYKFYIKASFNAKEHTSSIYFNITD